MYKIAALYKFAPLEDLEKHRKALLPVFKEAGIIGTLLIAPEGVNGTLAGDDAGIEVAVDAIRALPGCSELDVKHSWSEGPPFEKLKIKLKREIVTFKVPEADPNKQVGDYVSPADWNALIADPDTVVIDTRNDYEVELGTFNGAIDPKTIRFSDFVGWFRDFHAKQPAKKYALFCTGGIRCEKATAFLKSEGVEDVYHLKGGILKYLETIPEAESQWDGECFVFDERIAVGHGLKPSENHEQASSYRPKLPPRSETENS